MKKVSTIPENIKSFLFKIYIFPIKNFINY